MKESIQPNYNIVKVTCSTCNHEYELGTTSKEIKVDTCANCHPFYTGSQTFVQAQGRVERFNRRFAQKAEVLDEVPENKKAKFEDQEEKESDSL